MIVIPHCQREQLLAEHTLRQLVHARIDPGLGIRPTIRRGGSGGPIQLLGAPSRFAEGDYVRILDEAGIAATLDPRRKTRGLLFSRQQWGFCGRVARVSRVVRRIVDDNGRMRSVSRTVLLDRVDCDGVDGHQGCGRLCPLMFRDEWLIATEAPRVAETQATAGAFATVRSLDDIRATLDWRGRRGRLMFMPEQATYVGLRLRIARKLDRVLEGDREDAVVREPIYVLDGPRCTGAVRGACDRGCGLLWHADWLVLDPSATPVA